jgi:hypothetical protein
VPAFAPTSKLMIAGVLLKHRPLTSSGRDLQAGRTVLCGRLRGVVQRPRITTPSVRAMITRSRQIDQFSM